VKGTAIQNRRFTSLSGCGSLGSGNRRTIKTESRLILNRNRGTLLEKMGAARNDRPVADTII
jgi:hypothetical protein